MNDVIKLHEAVEEAIVNHAFINSKLECGGYLFGYTKRIEDGIEVIITDAYYEKTFGTDRRFIFGISYLQHAKNYLAEQRSHGRRIQLVGCYHSHGKYQPVFSETDRGMQKTWIGNKATLIYSPKYNQMVGDIITSTGHVIQSRVTTFNSDIYSKQSFANIALPENKDNIDLIYDNVDRPLTLKYKPKKR